MNTSIFRFNYIFHLYPKHTSTLLKTILTLMSNTFLNYQMCIMYTDRLYGNAGEGTGLQRRTFRLYATMDTSVLFAIRCRAILHECQGGQKLRPALQIPHTPDIRSAIPHPRPRRRERCCIHVRTKYVIIQYSLHLRE